MFCLFFLNSITLLFSWSCHIHWILSFWGGVSFCFQGRVIFFFWGRFFLFSRQGYFISEERSFLFLRWGSLFISKEGSFCFCFCFLFCFCFCFLFHLAVSICSFPYSSFLVQLFSLSRWSPYLFASVFSLSSEELLFLDHVFSMGLFSFWRWSYFLLQREVIIHLGLFFQVSSFCLQLCLYILFSSSFIFLFSLNLPLLRILALILCYHQLTTPFCPSFIYLFPASYMVLFVQQIKIIT